MYYNKANIGLIKDKAHFKNKNLTKYQIYSPEGDVLEERKGNFSPLEALKFSYTIDYLTNPPDRKLKNGSIRKYIDGTLKEEAHYKNGEILRK